MIHHVEIYVSDLERSIAFWSPLLQRLGYEAERWSGGMNYFPEGSGTYFCFLPAPEEHRAAGYHRKRVGLNHIALAAESRAQVDAITAWVRGAGHSVLYEDRHPYAGGPGYYALFCEDPDRIKVEIVAPNESES